MKPGPNMWEQLRPGQRVLVRERAGKVDHTHERVVRELDKTGFLGVDPTNKNRRHWYEWKAVVDVLDDDSRGLRRVLDPAVANRIADRMRESERVHGRSFEKPPPKGTPLPAPKPEPAPPAPPTPPQPPAPVVRLVTQDAHMRFSKWLDGYLNAQAAVTAGPQSRLAEALQVSLDAVGLWRKQKRAPTEDDVLEFAALLERAGETVPKPHADWLVALTDMVHRDLAAGVPPRGKMGKQSRRDRLRAEAAKSTPLPPQPKETHVRATHSPQEAPAPKPAATPAPEPPRPPQQASAAAPGTFEARLERVKLRLRVRKEVQDALAQLTPDEQVAMLAELIVERDPEAARG